MRKTKLYLVSIVALVLFGVGASPALAAKPECGDGKCQGQENPDTCSADCTAGGDEGQKPEVDAIITFGDTSEDGIRGDCGPLGGSPPCPYPDPTRNLVRAYIGGGSVFGVIFLSGLDGGLSLFPPGRQLFLDFSDCTGSDCAPPSQSQGLFRANLRAEVHINVKDGVYGITEPDPDADPPIEGGFVDSPMRIVFLDPPGPGDDDPHGPTKNWVLRFSSGNHNKCPASTYVRVTRTGNNTWEVTDNGAKGCLTKGISGKSRGLYSMPFLFRVVVPDCTPHGLTGGNARQR